MPKTRVTQSNLKRTAKNTITRKNKMYIGGGVPIAEQLLNVKNRDDFRSMFNNTFHVIYRRQTDQEPSKYEEGVKELILVAQDSTCYGLDIYGKRSLDSLLRALSDASGAEWIRLMYAYPSKFPKEILPVIAERDNICSYIDMPMQHISTQMLKSMRRGITRKTTEELIHHIKETVPGITLRTTFIVGYPGETEEDFQELCDFVSTGALDRMGVFTYSQEDDTYAYILGDPISQEVKDERRTILLDLQKQISHDANQELIGKRVRAMVEQEINGEYQCRTEKDAPEVDNELYVRSDKPLKPGDMIWVEIDDAAEFDLFGHIVE